MNREYQICTTCVMDSSDPGIIFDEQGVCNHCKTASENLKKISFKTGQERDIALQKIVDEIKDKGKNKKYDCVIGLSGGVDSSYLAYKVKELGLHPLAVHLDNGWNSELAVNNISNIVNKLGIDLYTYVIDWEEFRELQVAFLKSGVIDLEMLSDNAIVVSVYKIMKKYKIGYFLIGANIATESIMPKSWLFQPKYDSLNILSIYRKYGCGLKLKTFPLLNFFDYVVYNYFKGHKSIPLLNYMYYNKPEALVFLEKNFDYKPYPGKHYESRITQFYQSYILPKKYEVDKRKAHLSSLIASGQITREMALKELNNPLFKSEMEEKNEIEFFCKKLKISEEEFAKIMNSDPVSHFNFSSYYGIHLRLSRFYKKIFGK